MHSAIPSMPAVNSTHPFFPTTILVPDYIPQSLSTFSLLTIFSIGLAVIIHSSRVLLWTHQLHLTAGENWTATWFILCGFIHTFFEGYFSYNSLRMGSRTDLFGQLWKEYSLSDSRYMTRDSFVVCMESVTAYLWGPLSFLCAYYIIQGHSLRHPLQLIISVGQLYGLILYYATCAFEEFVHQVVLSHPSTIYYYVYYIICNAFWLFIPGYLIFDSVRETGNAFEFLKTTKDVKAKNNVRAAKSTL